MRGGIRRAKNQVKLVILAFAAVLALAAAAGISHVFAGLTRSGEVNEIFNAAARVPQGMEEAVVWETDNPDLVRQVEPLTRSNVMHAWLKAWEQLTLAPATGDTVGIRTYFSSSARTALVGSIEGESAQEPVHQIAHRLKVNFYSLSGEIMGIRAEQVEAVRGTRFGSELGYANVVESYDVVMILDDGNWRVFHWVRDSQESTWWSDPVAPASEPARMEGLGRGINYYSREHAFNQFWPNFDPDVVAADFDRIAELGFDSIRIFLPFHEFGGHQVGAEELTPVVELLDLAEARGLKVVATLFDGRVDHRTQRWHNDRVHLETLIPVLASHPALAMWDLKNEPDRDIGRHGVSEPLLQAWLGYVAHIVRDLDPKTPTTIGWTTAQAALANPVITEVVSFHHYAPASELDLVGPALLEHADGRPVWLTEYGLPTWNSFFPGGHTEPEQAVYAADVLDAADRVGLDATMVWTLWDLAHPPPDAGMMPWKTGPQTHLGLLRADGSAKPAAAVAAGQIDPDQVVPLHWTNRLYKRFWQLGIVVVSAFNLAQIVSLIHRWRLRRHPRKGVDENGVTEGVEAVEAVEPLETVKKDDFKPGPRQRIPPPPPLSSHQREPAENRAEAPGDESPAEKPRRRRLRRRRGVRRARRSRQR